MSFKFQGLMTLELFLFFENPRRTIQQRLSSGSLLIFPLFFSRWKCKLSAARKTFRRNVTFKNFKGHNDNDFGKCNKLTFSFKIYAYNNSKSLKICKTFLKSTFHSLEAIPDLNLSRFVFLIWQFLISGFAKRDVAVVPKEAQNFPC